MLINVIAFAIFAKDLIKGGLIVLGDLGFINAYLS
jgi:hypothetical protein